MRWRRGIWSAAVVAAGCGDGGPPPVEPPEPGGAGTTLAFADTPLGRAARRGHALMTATRDSLPDYVGNDLRCVSCHLDDGRRPFAMPWTGVYARFPQYRARSGAVDRLEDRINDCFERSLAGARLPVTSQAMTDIVTYMAVLSLGTPVGGRVPGQGLDSVTAAPGDPARGERVYGERCARCHGADGAGRPGYPALWGPRSYTIGAGMARVRALAAFVSANMPYDAPRTLSPQQAMDVAAFVNSRPRPDFARKADDWPRGGAPPDVAYWTKGEAADPRPRDSAIAPLTRGPAPRRGARGPPR